MTLPINPTYKFSLYKNLLSAKAPEFTIDINQLYEIIKFGYLKQEILALRSTSDKKKANQIKKSDLYAVTLSGIFEHRKNKGLIKHSGLMQIDLDNVSEYDKLFSKICKDDYTYMAFRSPRGKGIKVIVKVNPSADTHLDQFLALEQYYKDYFKINLDRGCKDVSRAMLLSFDPDIYCNPHANVFEELFIHKINIPKKNIISTKNHAVCHVDFSTNEMALVKEIASTLAVKKIDITSSYDKWWRVALSVANTLGEEGRPIFHQISSVYEAYDVVECDQFYTNVLHKNQGKITLGTLIHYTREAGIEVSRNSNKSQVALPNKATDLKEALRKIRLDISKKREKPAFTVFSNKVLDQLLSKKPLTKSELLQIKGLGKQKVKEFGHEILKVVRRQ